MSHTLHWQKSSFSDGGEGNTCVEVAASPETSTSARATPPASNSPPHQARWPTSYAG